MSLFELLTLTLVIFTSRYLFLEPALPLRLNRHLRGILRYAGPAVLTAIWGPVVFIHGEPGRFALALPELAAATLAALLAWRTHRVLLTVTLSMALYFLLRLW
ncbi:AzlD domain-containing protein [Marichromatium gracile]|uniref:AzlD domain-containing protein n=1 Tax=Marichromatium gracile TaxID=1048 RepID=UPI001F2A3061|nr:AzlD domain-containing protein [Marichromatium gracile]MCF1183387.1 AzlD domain-containing protein [Marichromatium gracile]